MRKIGAFDNETQAIAFIEYLQKRHITALIEEDSLSYAIWVHDEGHIENAKKLFADVKKDTAQKKGFFGAYKEKTEVAQGPFRPFITRAMLFACILVYILAQVQSHHERENYPGMNSLPPVAKALLFEFPKDQEILGEIIDRFGLETFRANTLPDSAEQLIKKHNEAFPWIGAYNILLQPKQLQNPLWDGLFMTKIKEGEVYRLFTPAILHLNLLHILFNLLWLMLLGKIIEFNMGKMRFFLLIFIAAGVSNVSQYLMTGPLFMGVSGVLSAFIGYVWVRKKIAPWEVYLIPKQNITYFLIFILGFLAVSIVCFLLAYFNVYVFLLPVANTAHISGLLVGMLIARLGILSKRNLR